MDFDENVARFQRPRSSKLAWVNLGLLAYMVWNQYQYHTSQQEFNDALKNAQVAQMYALDVLVKETEKLKTQISKSKTSAP